MSQVYEPLFVDTNIEYAIDPAKFPGICDPQAASEPQLLIHSVTTCSCHLREEAADLYTCVSSTQTSVAEPELYDLIDLVSSDDEDPFLSVPDNSLCDLSFLEDLSTLDSSSDFTPEDIIFQRLCDQLDIELNRPERRKRKHSDGDNTSVVKKQRIGDDSDCLTGDLDDVLLSRGL